ncbi:MAG: glycosyltransferase family 2 protein [Bacteroidetes bacterium]|nr:glycosyltransferase family 2 protein [Bacteroidota bacterium]
MISVVIPVYNEQDLIDSLYQRVSTAVKEINEDFEIICVDDGSTDTSLEKMLKIHEADKRFKVLTLSRNFGHQAAYTAGLNYAKGDHVVMMDGDLQDPPEMIKEMYAKATNEGIDVVFGKRTGRKEGPVRRMLFSSFHRVFSRMSSINAPANVGNFSILSRRAVNELIKLSEKTRYLPGLRYFIGFKQGYVEYKRPDRESGQAKMSTSNLMRLALDAIFSFSNIPIKFCLYIGMLGIIVFFSAGVFSLTHKIIGLASPGWSSTLLSIYFLGSVQLLFLGVIGEYVYRIYKESQNRPIYIVSEFHD